MKDRRASIDRETRECERRLGYLREALGHLDPTLALFDPDGNPKAIKAKRPHKRVKKAQQPLTAAEVTGAVVADLGYGVAAMAGISTRVRGNCLPLENARFDRQGRRARNSALVDHGLSIVFLVILVIARKSRIVR